ncbi:hypothetical protein ACS8FD_06110 [Psychrobacter sp. 1U2]|uniref:hypothetical protein n=1 Tax=Psychrobacter sp. 1U2 TaxID=3453577 RepID=UPI003F457E1C
MLRSGQNALQSHIKQGVYFWIAAVLVFFTAIRRELNHLPELFIDTQALWLGHNYDWWEDRILLVIYIVALGLLVYAWRYCWAVLKTTPLWLYLSVAVLALLQYIGENALGFSHSLGIVVEELSETAIYLMALGYLWSFKVPGFEEHLEQRLELQQVTH